MSRTSVSPSNSVEPQRGQGVFGRSTVGSIGRSASSGRSISPQAVQNQTGIGVAKIRWREMHQSHSIFPTQSSIRRSMCSGTQRTSRAASRIAPGSTFTNHCRSERISIGVLHRQQVPTRCSSGTCRFRTPASAIAPRTASRHSGAVIPSYGPASAVMRPVESSAGRSSRPCVFHQTTSCLSPKVQIITAPEPKAGSTASSRTTGTAWPKSGTVSGPASAAYRSSVGVDGHRDAGRQELGAGRGDLEAVEVEEVQLRGPTLVRDLGERDRGLAAGAEVDRVLRAVDVAVVEHPEERGLGLPVVGREHGHVLVRPVDREGHAAHGDAHLADVLRGQLAAEPAELLARQVVLGDPLLLLDLDLGGQAVAVPPLREHDVVAPHSPVPGQEVDVAPVEGVPDVEVPGRVRRRGVDHELRPVRGRVEVVVLVAPARLPPLLDGARVVGLRQFGKGPHPSEVACGPTLQYRTIEPKFLHNPARITAE